MTNILPFNFNGTEVRVIVDDDGTVHLVASDAAKHMGYDAAAKLTRMLPEDEKGVQIVDTPGGAQQMATITEPGLYRAIFNSRRPEAEPFLRWVTHEVLPTIRKHGHYGVIREQQHIRHPEAADLAQAGLLIFDKAVETLKPDPASQHQMLQHLAALVPGLDEQLLPGYTQSVGVHHSLTHQLKGSPLTARQVNPILEELGYQEQNYRGRSDGTTKPFWVVTEAGQQYGLNLVSPKNKSETQPHWYDSSFVELLAMVRARLV